MEELNLLRLGFLPGKVGAKWNDTTHTVRWGGHCVTRPLGRTRLPRRSPHEGVKPPFAAAIALLVAILVAPVLIFMGAFSLRLLLGVETYRDSGAWVGVVGGGALAAVAVGALAYRGLVADKG